MEIAGVADTHGPVWANLVSPGWLATFRTPLVAGRDLGDRDRAGAPRVAIVNQTLARMFGDGVSPIGRTMTLYPHTVRALGPNRDRGRGRRLRVRLASQSGAADLLHPIAQFDYLTDLGIRSINLSVRSGTASPLSLTSSVTSALATVDPQLSLTFRPLVNQVGAALTQERLIALVSGFFGALALLLAALGLSGVTAYAVTEPPYGDRHPDGPRRARGQCGPPRAGAHVVAGECGVGLGTAASLWTSRFVTVLIYGIEPRDPVTLAGALFVLALVAVLAAWFPARRAARTDPAAVLRES